VTLSRLYGTVVRLHVEVAVDLPHDHSGQEPDLTVTLNDSKPPEAQRWTVYEDVDAYLTGRELRVAPRHALPPLLLGHVILDHAIPQALSLLGDVVLHGACVALERRAVVLLGESGRGKSTLAAHMAGSGWRVLADDATVVSLADQVLTYPSYPGLRLHQDVATQFPHHWTQAVTELTAKHRVVPRVAWTNEPAEAAALVLLDPSGSTPVEALGSAASLAAVAKSTFQAAVDEPNLAERLDRLVELVQRLPVLRLGIAHSGAGSAVAEAAIRQLATS
jgi:predicted ATPase